jgi:hypothetical protein
MELASYAACPSACFGSVKVRSKHPIQWVPGALSLEVKRPGCEADH